MYNCQGNTAKVCHNGKYQLEGYFAKSVLTELNIGFAYNRSMKIVSESNDQCVAIIYEI